jgi:hypothetical protein
MADDRRVGGRGEDGVRLKERLATARRPEEQAQRLLDGDTWQAFCRHLEAAGEHVRTFPQADDPRVRAEGFRYLMGLAATALDQALSLGDPEAPRFVRDPDSLHKWGAENADNQYLWARIDPTRRYRIRGLRRGVFDFLVELKEGYMQLGEDGVYAAATTEELRFDADGTFEIVLSSESPAAGADGTAPNWLPLHPDARYVTVRQYLIDWEREEPADFHITCLDAEDGPSATTAAAVAGRIDAAGLWVEQSARFWSEWVTELRDAFEPGRIRPARRFVGGAKDIYYGNDWWRLGPDEAFVIETERPDARYWQFQLGDAWFRSLDWANRQTSLNLAQTLVDADGRVRFVVAHRDPGVPNWLDTAGHPEGMLQYRWIWTRDCPEPRGRILPFDHLREALPPETPVVTPEERSRSLALRRAHLQRREPIA